MAQEIDLGGTIYISSKHAAEKTGYTQDYIGQLARGGSIEARRVSGMWYILEESLRSYKEKADLFVPTPPPPISSGQDLDSSVSFDGKDYISASRAAKITGYHQDYVGQLARSGHVLSRQIGSRWYVDREALLAHKEEKDSLLAAVQAESVGLQRHEPEPVAETPSPVFEEETHFTYVEEVVSLIPEVPEPEPVSEPVPPIDDVIDELPPIEPFSTVLRQELEEMEELNPIPIRVVAPHVAEQEYSDEEYVRPQRTVKAPKKANIFILSALTVAAALGTVVYIGDSMGYVDVMSMIRTPESSQNASAASTVTKDASNKVQNVLQDFFSKELVYKRK